MANETRNGRKRSGNAPADDEGNGATAVAEETPYKYYVKGERPRADGAFFELLLAKVVEERGALPDFDEIWPRGAQALAGLNPLRLSQHTADELENIIGTVGGEFAARLGNRTGDLILWADAFWTIRQIYGSFRQYVRSFDTDGHEALIDDLTERLNGLSAKLIVSYLRDVGEKIPNLPKIDPPQAQGGRSAKPRTQSKQGRGGNHGGGGRRRSGRGGNKAKNGGERPPDGQQPQPPKPAKANQEKNGSKNRRGRKGFFRRKRGAKPKTETAEKS